MRTDYLEKVKSNYIKAFLIHEVSVWIINNSIEEFCKKTGISENALEYMVHLKYAWDIDEIMKVSDLLKKDLLIFNHS
ncbi:hypothetical protein [uncultured Tenacibaculum sp.]|uniref:hypothetical protein n=1 Tax=uncultured Tenacibaculum sp. TaxID=174713 RepID=UPI00262F516B|nr:hypothetical protein [uncultured Tenacibaculum sp.]